MNSKDCSISADFLDYEGRKLFFVLLQPGDGQAHSSILFLPPFAEEMHMSRHIVSHQARALAAAGYNVMLLDPTGCGDAGGEFRDASWRVWLEDAAFALDTLAQLGTGKLMLWGLRAGALLASDLAHGRSDINKMILWQPVLNGEQQIDQFLRLQTTASAIANSLDFDRTTLWSQLRSGQSLEIAGYDISSGLALEMAKVRLIDLNPVCPVSWFQIGSSPRCKIPVANANVIARWQDQRALVDARYIEGAPFWRTPDASINSELYSATLKALGQQ